MSTPEMHKWDPADYHKSSSAQYNWAMALIADLFLEGDERILDIGCGDGRVTAHLAGLVPSGSVLGIDLSPEMISFAAGQYIQIIPISLFGWAMPQSCTFRRNSTWWSPLPVCTG